MKNLRLRGKLWGWSLLALFLAVLVALNIAVGRLETRHGWRRDLSFNALTTTSQATEAVLAQVDKPVHIYALYNRGDEDQPLMELLNRYAAHCSYLTWEKTDISLNPALLQRFRSSTSDGAIASDSLIVSCEQTGRFKVLSPSSFVSLSFNQDTGYLEEAGYTYERALTSAIRYVSQDRLSRAMILQGQGELDADGTAVLASLLEANSYEVHYFTLSSIEVELTPEDLLLVLSPTRDLTADELDRLTAFTSKGGSVLFTCDFTDPAAAMPNWLALWRSYGFVPKEGVVIASADEKNTYYSGNRLYLLPVMQNTEITSSLVEGNSNTLLMAGSRGFAMPLEQDKNLNVQALLTSGEKAYLRLLTDGKDTIERQGGDEEGPFALGLMASRLTEEGYMTRAVMLGCSSMLTSSEVYSMTNTAEFLVRCFEYLLNTEPVDMSIVAKPALRPQLSARSVASGTALAVALPFAVLAAAVAVLGRRRSRDVEKNASEA